MSDHQQYFDRFADFSATQRRYSVSYYFATRFLPKAKREATEILYSWFRVPDEIVDNAHEIDQPPMQLLEEWISEWEEVCKSGQSRYAVLDATARVFRQYDIPVSYSMEFLAAMRQDLSVGRYGTYADLEGYMYGSAGVVGLIMADVLGHSNGADEAAVELGYAMQLTNFMRDIGEDYQERGRIYFPQADLERFGITEAHIRDQDVAVLRPLLQEYDARIEVLYARAMAGVGQLRSGQLGVLTAAYVYRGILTKIRQANYDVFSCRHATSGYGKLALFSRALWHYITKK